MPRKPKRLKSHVSGRHAKQGTGRRADSVGAELRIIGGTMRGRKFAYSGDPQTRPMKDRVREAVFNLVGAEAAGKHAVDMFAGTGALGLEAISRGAVAATLLERHFPTAAVVRRNCETLGVADRTYVLAVDAFVWARRELGGEGGPRSEEAWRDLVGNAAWLVFVSPPYDFYVERRGEMLALVELVERTAPAGSIVVIEADGRFDMGQLRDAEAWDVRAYPPAVVAVWRKPERQA